ncbi:hypothetical protein PSPTOT1_3768 [Pseudomonas phage phiPto-bp6g]|nr:hypothetical protein PSPTOT1_3768 [Pseudomonas phage phiPto-bp6g]
MSFVTSQSLTTNNWQFYTSKRGMKLNHVPVKLRRMNMSEVNWDIAPVDATHHGKVNNPDIIAWYRYESLENDNFQWYFLYSELGIPVVGGWCPLPAGQWPLQLPLTPRPKSVEPVTKVSDWIPGTDLPPVGIECEFAVDYLAENSSLYKKDIKAGTRVRIIAHIENPIFDIAVFLYKDENGHKLVRQAIAEAFRPLRTEEEIAADEKEAFLKMFAENIGAGNEGGEYALLSKLYDHGYIGMTDD